MRIEDVLRETVAGIFSSRELRDSLVLKGGAALQLAEGLNNRLSVDIDLSVPQERTLDPDATEAELARVQTERFDAFGLDVIDPVLERRPKRRRKDRPDVWGGWNFTFKLTSQENRKETLATRRRSALVPVGAASSKIEIQISEHEYCERTRIQLVNDVEVLVYTPALLIAEKLRAICQQHPDYPYRQGTGRARDFFDIHAIHRKHRKAPDLIADIAEILDPVFAAKYVPLSLVQDDYLFSQAFIAAQAADFLQVRLSARTKVQDFTFYVEQLKMLVHDVLAVRTNHAGANVP